MEQVKDMAADYVSVGVTLILLATLIVLISYFTKSWIFANRILVSRENLARVDTVSDLSTRPKIPQSVNYHFTRQCNYRCGFCFHTAKTSFVLPLEEAKRGLQMLKEAGMYHR